MELTPVKFLSLFLVICSAGWILFSFTAKLLGFLLSRMTGALISFRIAGVNCLKDILIQYQKGALKSLTIGELRLKFNKPFRNGSLDISSWDLKLHLYLCDMEIVLTQPPSITPKKVKRRATKHSSTSRGKWMVIASIAQYLKISASEILVRVLEIPKASWEVKTVNLDMSKGDTAGLSLGVRFSVMPCNLLLANEVKVCEDSSIFRFRQTLLSVGRPLEAEVCTIDTIFSAERFLMRSTLEHDRETGVRVKHIDVEVGDTFVNLPDCLDLRDALSPTFEESSTNTDKVSQVVCLAADDSNGISDASNASEIAAVGQGLENGHVHAVLATNNSIRVDKNSILKKIPQKVDFSLPKLRIRCSHLQEDLVLENEITGLHLQSSLVIHSEEASDIFSQLDIQLDCGEIHIIRENDCSLVEIMKVAVAASVEFPAQPNSPFRAEVDVKLGGTQFSLLTHRFKEWMQLKILKQRQEKTNNGHISRQTLKENRKSNQYKRRLFCWVCSVSAPEMTVVLYSLDGLRLFHVTSQTLHLYINSVSGKGAGLHVEVAEMYMTVSNEEEEFSKQHLSGVDTVPGCVVHFGRIVLDWGLVDCSEDDSRQERLTCITEIGNAGIFLGFTCLRAFVHAGLALETCAKLYVGMKSASKIKQGRHNNKLSKSVKCLKLHVDGFLMEFCDSLQVGNILVPDPKKVNFGCQGGEVVITKSQDGKLRTASVKALPFEGRTHLDTKGKILLELPALHLFVDRDKDFAQIDIERGKLVYQELDDKSTFSLDRTLFGLQNVKFVLKPARVDNGIRKHSVLSATEITIWWEPDIHLFLSLTLLHFKQLLRLHQNARASLFKSSERVSDNKVVSKDRNPSSSPIISPKKQSWWKTALAVDIEALKIRAELADGVHGAICIQSIFSEDAEIGIVVEDAEISLNNCTVFRNERLQVSRVPVPVPGPDSPSIQCNTSSTNSNIWDCIVQGSGTRLVMPYRLPIRAIDDAVEDMWRGLKLSLAAQRMAVIPDEPTASPKAKKERSMQFRAVKLHIYDFAVEIEEEPIQGWLDEHQRILRTIKQESLLRERLLEEELQDDKKNKDLDSSTISSAWEALHRKTFQAYQDACAKLVPYIGSGACNGSYQGGFSPSQKRGSLLSVHASNLDLVLTEIDGGREGMISTIRKLDCVDPETSVPFARVLGRQIEIATGSLRVRLRDYSHPMLDTKGGKCKGVIIFAQQATCFPKQLTQELYIGRWRKVEMLRSISGSTPSWKMYSELPITFDIARVSFGVGFEPAIADVSYAFTVALRRTDLSVRKAAHSDTKQSNMSVSLDSSSVAAADLVTNVVRKERSLPWWDDMRYYVHGKNTVTADYFEWSFLATTDPYENVNMMRICACPMIIEQSEGRLVFNGKNFDLHVTSTEAFVLGPSLDLKEQPYFIHAPVFLLEITMDWECSSGEPHNHYLHAFPIELEPREKVYDPFRSTSLALGWNFSLKTLNPESTDSFIGDHMRESQELPEKVKPKVDCTSRKLSRKIFSKNSAGHFRRYDLLEEISLPSMNIGAHDLIWVFKWWSLFFSPPHKLRSFSRWPRFGVKRLPRSGNLSLDKVLTEFILRVDAFPACIKHASLMDDDPAEGLTFNMQQLNYELCYSRGRQHYTFDCKRDILELVYQGVDVQSVIAQLDRKMKFDNDDEQHVQKSDKVKQLLGFKGAVHDESSQENRRPAVILKEHGFLFTTDRFTVRKQAPKADPTRLSLWRDNFRVQARPKSSPLLESGSDSGSEPVFSDPSDDESFDDSFNVVLADNCLRVSLYGLKLFWTIPNRDAVWAWVGDISRAFESPKPSPSRQYAQRKMMEEKKKAAEEIQFSESSSSLRSSIPESLTHVQPDLGKESTKDGSEEEGTLQFMVNVIQPQFNLHSEDAHGRFLLAAASGRVLARSFHSIYYVGFEMIEQALGQKGVAMHGNLPQITWKRRELSVLLENVQAHVAPTDVDPGAGLQWLPKIPRRAPDVKRTGVLLERVFMPCTMYFQYTRHKGGTDCKVKPLKELSFNSPNIAATMTSCQFHIMVDVISNLLLARLPKPRKKNFLVYGEKDEVIEEEADEVVPDGVEEVEQARIKLEQVQRECKLLFDDLKTLKSLESVSQVGRPIADNTSSKNKEGLGWVISSKTSALIQKVETEFAAKCKARKHACVSLRLSLQRAAQQRLMEKEKNKSPSAAMRISWAIDKVVWSMLSDGELFAEAEISSMILNVDRDFDDIGVARFTIKSFVAKNCLPNADAKSNLVLSAWNPPKEWGRNVMLRVDAKQGAQKEGSSPLERFEVEIYPLKIHLTEAMYTMMWEYFFPEEENDSQKRQVWRIPTTTAVRQSRKGSSGMVENAPNQSVVADIKKDGEYNPQTSVPGTPLKPFRLTSTGDIPHLDIALAAQASETTRYEKLQLSKDPEHRRSSSFDSTWEDKDSYFFASEITLKSQNSNLLGSSRRPAVTSSNEVQVRPTFSSDVGADAPSGKTKESRRPVLRGNKASHEERKELLAKKAFLEFYNIKISQVELLVTYEGSRFSVNDLRLLMDTFTRAEFLGSWRRLFSRVKKHIIWSVLKSVAGMQGKKFKDKSQGLRQEGAASDSHSTDSCASTTCNKERFLIPPFKRQSDRAGEGFVSSIKGLFNSQRRKAKALVRRTIRGGDAAFDFQRDWSEGEADGAQIGRQLSRSKAKQLLKRRQTKKLRSINKQKGVILLGDRYHASPRSSPYYSEADSSAESSAYEDFND